MTGMVMAGINNLLWVSKHYDHGGLGMCLIFFSSWIVLQQKGSTGQVVGCIKLLLRSMGSSPI